MTYPLGPSCQKIQADLYQAVDNHQVPHAQLFASPEGSAALPLLQRVATYLHCTNKSNHQPCAQCRACTKMHKHIHPDHHHLFPVGRTSNKEGDLHAALPLWRTFLQKQPYGNLQDWSEHLGSEARKLQINTEQVDYLRNVLHQKPFESSCKTILVWLPEQLNLVAANKMLKMVEEPSPHTYFFFVSTAPYHILPTLRSRMWMVSMPAWHDETIRSMLQKEHGEPTEKQLRETLHIAQGNLSLAKKIITGTALSYFEPVIGWFRVLYAQKLGDLVTTAETFHGYKPMLQKNWLTYALQLLRAALMIPFDNRHTNLTEAEAAFCKKFHATIGDQPIPSMMLCIDQLGKVLERHANAKLAFMNTSFAIMHLLASKAKH